MSTIIRKRANPLNDFEYAEEPFDVKEKFTVHVPIQTNSLLEILQKHLEKQRLLKESTGFSKSEKDRPSSKTDILRPASVNSDHRSSRASKLRERISNTVTDARKSMEADSITKNENVKLFNEVQEVEEIATKGQEVLQEVQPQLVEEIDVSNNQPLIEGQNIVSEVQQNEIRLEDIVNKSREPKPLAQANTNDIDTKSTTTIKVSATTAENKIDATNQQGESLETDYPNQVAQSSINQEKSLRESKSSKTALKDLFRVSTSKLPRPATRDRLLTSPGVRNRTVASPDAKGCTMTSFGFRFNKGPLNELNESKKLTLDEALNDRLSTVVVGELNGATYGPLSNITPLLIRKNRQKSSSSFTVNSVKGINSTSPAVSKQMQYDFETRSYVGSLLRNKGTEDITRYEDMILKSQDLLGGLLKLRDMKLLKQNPVLIRKFRGWDKINTVDGHHGKLSGPGFSRNNYGGFY